VLSICNKTNMSSKYAARLIYQASWPILEGVRHGGKRSTREQISPVTWSVHKKGHSNAIAER
jgi:hypothetical protein